MREKKNELPGVQYSEMRQAIRITEYAMSLLSAEQVTEMLVDNYNFGVEDGKLMDPGYTEEDMFASFTAGTGYLLTETEDNSEEHFRKWVNTFKSPQTDG